jgi:hypothetical protein
MTSKANNKIMIYKQSKLEIMPDKLLQGIPGNQQDFSTVLK